jgi:hypothetical protein
MSRMYHVAYTGTIANAGGNADLLEASPADDKPIKLRGFVLSQVSEIGDAAEEGLRITVQRFPATVTSGNGTAVTPVPLDSADTAAGFAAECNGATVASTSGSAVVLEEIGWNIRNSPYEHWYPDERFCPKAKQGEALIVRMETTPADDFTGCFTFILEEE